MSNFTSVLVRILERMKETSGTTRNDFAKRAGMPPSTLASYYDGVNTPTTKALSTIAGALDQVDGRELIIAHLIDETPAEWRGEIRFVADGVKASRGLTLKACETLPPQFSENLVLLMEEAKRNEHIPSFVADFVRVLGLEGASEGTPPKRAGVPPDAVWPEGKLPAQNVPARVARTSARRGDSTPSSDDVALVAEKEVRYAGSKGRSKPRGA